MEVKAFDHDHETMQFQQSLVNGSMPVMILLLASESKVPHVLPGRVLAHAAGEVSQNGFYKTRPFFARYQSFHQQHRHRNRTTDDDSNRHCKASRIAILILTFSILLALKRRRNCITAFTSFQQYNTGIPHQYLKMDMIRKDSVFGIDVPERQLSDKVVKENEKDSDASRFADKSTSLNEDKHFKEDYEDDENRDSGFQSYENWKEDSRSRGLVEVRGQDSAVLGSGVISEVGGETDAFGTEEEDANDDDDGENDGRWQNYEDWKERRFAEGMLDHQIEQDSIDLGIKESAEEGDPHNEDTTKKIPQKFGGLGAISSTANPQAGSSPPSCYQHSAPHQTAKWWFTGQTPPPPPNPRNTFRWTLPGLSSAQPFQIPGPFYRAAQPRSPFVLPGLSSAQPFQIPGPFYRRPPPPTLAQRPPLPLQPRMPHPRPRLLQPSNPLAFPIVAQPPRSNQPSTTSPGPFHHALKRKAGSNELRLAYRCQAHTYGVCV